MTKRASSTMPKLTAIDRTLIGLPPLHECHRGQANPELPSLSHLFPLWSPIGKNPALSLGLPGGRFPYCYQADAKRCKSVSELTAISVGSGCSRKVAFWGRQKLLATFMYSTQHTSELYLNRFQEHWDGSFCSQRAARGHPGYPQFLLPPSQIVLIQRQHSQSLGGPRSGEKREPFLCSLQPSRQPEQCAALSTSLLPPQPGWRRRALRQSVVRARGASQLVPFLAHLAAEAPSHTEEVLVQRQLGCGSRKPIRCLSRAHRNAADCSLSLESRRTKRGRPAGPHPPSWTKAPGAGREGARASDLGAQGRPPCAWTCRLFGCNWTQPHPTAVTFYIWARAPLSFTCRRVPARLPPAFPAPGRARNPACEEKAWIRRVGENKEPVEDAGPIVWALGEPRPARTLAPCSGFLLLFSPTPAFLPLLLPASVPRQKKGLSLRVHSGP
ncbi:uncharacterized protein LOC129402217 [Sorex araneus]|uniref:uncharacterized protein LOC129402217 n=1 Tax=Sorex araneus TaxID=42254 RepID=UPI002433FF5D|nr:uncharacterized protein LOC129402217 [Sorex araneus]